MGSGRRGAFVVLAVAAVLAGCGGSQEHGPPEVAKAAPAKANLPPGHIAFRRYLDETHEYGAIFTVATDGSGERQVTEPADEWVDDHPDWSPDGKLIAYQHCPQGGEGAGAAVDKLPPCTVWTVAVAGGEPRRARFRCELKGRCDASGPAWTPGGALVAAVEQGRLGGSAGIQMPQRSSIEELDLGSREQRTLFARKPYSGEARTPAVSPDGKTVLYSRIDPTRAAVWAVGSDGSGDHQVAPWKLGAGDHPVFSPDGGVLFRSYENNDVEQSDLWTAQADGSGLRQFTHLEQGTRVLSTSYSPDGKWIVYGSNEDDLFDADLYVMPAGGGAGRPLAGGGDSWDSAPDWGP